MGQNAQNLPTSLHTHTHTPDFGLQNKQRFRSGVCCGFKQACTLACRQSRVATGAPADAHRLFVVLPWRQPMISAMCPTLTAAAWPTPALLGLVRTRREISEQKNQLEQGVSIV